MNNGTSWSIRAVKGEVSIISSAQLYWLLILSTVLSALDGSSPPKHWLLILSTQWSQQLAFRPKGTHGLYRHHSPMFLYIKLFKKGFLSDPWGSYCTFGCIAQCHEHPVTLTTSIKQSMLSINRPELWNTNHYQPAANIIHHHEPFSKPSTIIALPWFMMLMNHHRPQIDHQLTIHQQSSSII